MAGLRERKKEQTRQRIAAAAWRLFAERGYDAVTVNEIAEAAEVAKATLFSYFPTKESLALEGVADDDMARIVAARAPGVSPLQALRTHFHAVAARPLEPGRAAELAARVRVFAGSPALGGAAVSALYKRRDALAEVLAARHGATAAALMAAQIAAVTLTLQESFFRRLAEGAEPQEAGRALAADVDLAFDQLEHGLPGETG